MSTYTMMPQVAELLGRLVLGFLRPMLAMVYEFAQHAGAWGASDDDSHAVCVEALAYVVEGETPEE